jgi:cell wall-associated NlpC family hydrolase
MFRKSVKAVSTVIAVALTFTGISINADASVNVLPSGGVALALENGTKLENISNAKKSNIQIQSVISEEDLAELLVQDEDVSEEETYKNLVIAQVNDYVNVRSLPSEEGEIIGKLYDDSVGTFLSEEDGWYQIQSGTVTGYVKAEFCVTGEEAIELAKQVGTRIAKVTTTTLHVRTEPSLDASVLGLVPLDDELVVTDETDEWVCVDVEEGKGWVSKDFVTLHTEFVQAESKEEEAARLAKEEAERKKAREAAAAKAASKSSSKSSSSTVTATVSGEGSEMGKAVAEYALQFVGNPYVYGGTSLTNGADCSGFVMSVYANFGVSLPHSSASDRSQGAAVEGGLENAQPGDLICYSGHVALYIGNGQIVHASTAKTGIIVSNADYKKVLAVRRIF